MYFKEMYDSIYANDTWNQFCETRDWYELPNSIKENSWLYQEIEAIQRSRYRERPTRFIIYPRDIEVMYDCTPDAARNFLEDIREMLGLSVTGPVTYYDLRKYTRLDQQTILDFIMES